MDDRKHKWYFLGWMESVEGDGKVIVSLLDSCTNHDSVQTREGRQTYYHLTFLSDCQHETLECPPECPPESIRGSICNARTRKLNGPVEWSLDC